MVQNHREQRLVTVFGGAGLIGRHLVTRLSQKGWRIRLVSDDTETVKTLKPLGEVGQIAFREVDIRNSGSVEQTLGGAHAVVNLTDGSDQKGKKGLLEHHIKLSETIAKKCSELSVPTLIHTSALGVSEDSKSSYLKSRFEGESRVKNAFPDSIIIRPSYTFGTINDIFDSLARFIKFSPLVPCLNGNQDNEKISKIQPVYVCDVAEAISLILDISNSHGSTFELGGPVSYSWHDIMKKISDEIKSHTKLRLFSFESTLFLSRILKYFPYSSFNPEMVKQMSEDSVVSGKYPGFSDLGITPELMDAVLGEYLQGYRPMHRMIKRLGESTV